MHVCIGVQMTGVSKTSFLSILNINFAKVLDANYILNLNKMYRATI